ncbi:MAG: hypothetical protein JWQ25_629 [Daejeonella sp.]|nr:hypothetical protein [Daejeonella sp.]
MGLKAIVFSILVLLLSAKQSYCQVQPGEDYKKAENLARQANEQLQNGNVKEADALIKKSIESYPVFAVFEYAKTLAKLPDLLGANLIMDKLIERVASFPGSVITTSEPDAVVENLNKGSARFREFEKTRAHFHFLQKIYEVNKAYGDRKRILKSLLDLQIPVIIEKKDGWAPGEIQLDGEYVKQQAYINVKLFYEGDFDKLLGLLESKPISKLSPKAIHALEKSWYLTGKGDYAEAIKEAESVNGIFYKLEANMQLFTIYALMGDQRAMTYYKKLWAGLKESNMSYYSLALLDLAKKDYLSAIKNLETSSKVRTKELQAALLVENWELYKAYGDAYTGLKQYDKAKDQYNIALLYYPEYKPAIDGLAKLGVTYVQEIATDKTPPVIFVTSPLPTRGLKVSTAGQSVMVKGMASDPSGLKEVLVNGKKIYSQNDGNFWGDVVMVNGLNKVTVIAIDQAGNAAEKTFEIEKQAAPVVAVTTDVVPVEEKEGKNYCLLLAAQNYEDTLIPSLENPISDAIKLKLILKEKYNFPESNIITLFNPANADFKRQLLELTNTIQPEDNLLIFYAGHGIWVEKEKKGYWLMTDAKRNDVNTWLPNKDVLDLIAKLPSRHTLLITDACFSGSVFKTRGLKAGAPIALQEMDAKISRVAITSGNDTEVPDESVFMKYLVKALSDNNDQYLTAQKMFITQIIEAVMTETKTEPRYGTLELAGHVGGDFIFSKK